MSEKQAKVALVHDWLVAMRGGEKVLEALLDVFPGADVYTLVARPERLSASLRNRTIHTTSLQRIPFGTSHYRWFLPWFEEFMAEHDLSSYDLIVSTNTACAKWVPNPRRVPHVCYCNTPMRYIWDFFDDYFAHAAFPVRWLARLFRKSLQKIDLESNEGVSHFLANSNEVKERITRIYGRDSTILHPPVELDRFPLRESPPGQGSYYLAVTALVPYKRVDLAVMACNRLKAPLRIAGEGSEGKRLRKMAGPTIVFEGWTSRERLKDLYAQAKALLFPGLEDFGIVPVEAAASGCPVVAYGRGGVLDSMKEGVTGTFFREQTIESLLEGIQRLHKMSLDPQAMRSQVQVFSREEFLRKMREYITDTLPLQLG